MPKTPLRLDTETNVFTPKEIKTLVKDSQGISKLVFTHCSTLHKLMNDWVRIQEKGSKICKSISALKIHEFHDAFYPRALGPLTESLLDAIDGMGNIIEGIKIVNKQLKAASQLQPTNEPVINTWPAGKISRQVEKIYQMLLKEYELKQCITENIAHCRDEKLIEIYVSSWEFDVYFDENETSYLFADMGLA